MLAINPKERPSAIECLKHNFFTKEVNPDEDE
jgi:serine/threonine protein kinase